MASNPRRESLSLLDILNPSSDTYTPVPQHPTSPGAKQETEQSDRTQALAKPITTEYAPLYDQPMEAPSLASVIQVKTEPSRDLEFNEDDQELLAAAEVSEHRRLGQLRIMISGADIMTRWTTRLV